MWNAVAMARHQPLLSIRLLAILSFLAVLGAFVARGYITSRWAIFLAAQQ